VSAVAHSAPVEAPEPRSRRRPVRRARVASGVVWIAVIAALLAGVVAMNVAVLRLNVELDKTGRERAQLRAETAALESQVSSAQATARTQAQARKAGLVPALARETRFLDIGP
jgi:cell division protein FtsL